MAVVSNESADRVRTYVENAGYRMPVYLVDDTHTTGVDGRAIPRTYLIRPDGLVMYRHAGMADWNSEGVRRALARFAATERNTVSQGCGRESGRTRDQRTVRRSTGE